MQSKRKSHGISYMLNSFFVPKTFSRAIIRVFETGNFVSISFGYSEHCYAMLSQGPPIALYYSDS